MAKRKSSPAKAAKPAKASILDEIKTLRPNRGAWRLQLSAAQRADLDEVKRAFLAGELVAVSPKAITSYLLKRFNIGVSREAVMQWLRRADG